jgi:hypothetical protein
MKRHTLFSTLLLLAVCGQPHAIAAEQLRLAKAQFPEPRSPETEVEWNEYKLAYFQRYNAGPGSAPTNVAQFSDFDQAGRPLWFERDQSEELTNLIRILFDREQFDDLDRVVADWSSPRARLADGWWKLEWFPSALQNEYEYPGRDVVLQRIEKWKAHNPKSVGAAILEAKWWTDYAWKARGGGWASSVTPEGWRLFRERLEKAEKLSLESEPYASGNPLWGMLRLDLAGAQQRSFAEQFSIFESVIKHNRGYYQLYGVLAIYAAPKWGGDWDLVNEVIEMAETATKQEDGASVYARLYHRVQNESGEQAFDIFKHTRADWSHMKQGFEDILERYPHGKWNGSVFARYACQAGDGETYRRLRSRLGVDIAPEAFRKSLPLEVCDARLGPNPL